MTQSGRMLCALTWLPELQKQTLVDTGVRLKHHRGFTLGMIEGIEQLCLLCPEWQISTAVVSAWIRCGHSGEPVTRLASGQQDPRY